MSRQLFALTFRILFEAALTIAWHDHARGVCAAGSSRGEFFGRAREWLRHFLQGLGLVPAEVAS